jgi:predicted dehydrogenase
MGLVGPGFVGAHHIDAVRRLGFVDVIAVAASSAASARRKADALGVPRAYGSFEDLIADPDIHVVHNTTPNYLHVPVILAALDAGKHVISDKPLATTAADARLLLDAANRAGVVHAVTFNYRGNPLVQQAREMIAGGELGDLHFIHGAYLQDWLLEATDFSWRLEPEKGGESSAVGDIGSHWCDLVQHVSGRRIVEVFAELTTVIDTRLKPSASTEAFARGGGEGREAFRVSSEDLATIMLRFEGGAKGSVAVGQVCAGHKNGLWFEVNGRQASVRWEQERQNELWIGRRDAANSVLAKDPSLLAPGARAYAHLPGGHQEGWADAFCNVMRDVYGFIASGAHPGAAKPPAFATFEDGYHSACVVDAILESHRGGGVWTRIAGGSERTRPTDVAAISADVGGVLSDPASPRVR